MLIPYIYIYTLPTLYIADTRSYTYLYHIYIYACCLGSCAALRQVGKIGDSTADVCYASSLFCSLLYAGQWHNTLHRHGELRWKRRWGLRSDPISNNNSANTAHSLRTPAPRTATSCYFWLFPSNWKTVCLSKQMCEWISETLSLRCGFAVFRPGVFIG